MSLLKNFLISMSFLILFGFSKIPALVINTKYTTIIFRYAQGEFKNLTKIQKRIFIMINGIGLEFFCRRERSLNNKEGGIIYEIIKVSNIKMNQMLNFKQGD